MLVQFQFLYIRHFWVLQFISLRMTIVILWWSTWNNCADLCPTGSSGNFRGSSSSFKFRQNITLKQQEKHIVHINKHNKALLYYASGHQRSRKAHLAGNQIGTKKTNLTCDRILVSIGEIKLRSLVLLPWTLVILLLVLREYASLMSRSLSCIRASIATAIVGVCITT